MLSIINDYFFGIIETAIVFWGAYRVLEEKYSKSITISALAGVLILINVFMVLARNCHISTRSIIINCFAFIGWLLIFNAKFGKTLFFTLLLYYEMMIADFILGNLLAFVFGQNILSVIQSNDVIQLGYSIFCKTLMFFGIFITIQYFVKIDLDIPSKYWVIINSIFSLFFTIIIMFMGINPSIQTKENSINFFFIGLGYLLVNFLVIRLFGDLCFFFQNEKILSFAAIENEALQKQLALQENAINDMKQVKHDIKNNVMNLTYLIQEKQWEDALDYVVDFRKSTNETKPPVFCENNLVNAILNLKINLSVQNGIKFYANIDCDCKFNIPPIDLTSILSNLIDNAIEATVSVEKGEKYVQVKIYMYKAYTVICVCNPYLYEPKYVNGQYTTTKQEKSLHGIGLKTVNKTIKKYDGFLRISTEDRIFTATALLKNQ